VKTRLFLVAICLLGVGCASTGPLQPLSGGTARQAWTQLSRAANDVKTLSSYASVRVATPDGRRTFRAAIDVTGRGNVRMRAFTPVGTEVFAFDVTGDVMLFADHSSRKEWRGPFVEIAAQLGIPDELSAAEFARLLFGLPAGRGSEDLTMVGEGIVRQGALTYEVTGVGLARVTREGSSWSVVYDPANFPPEKVTFEEAGGRSIVVRHLDVSHSMRDLEPFDAGARYECCYRPLISKE